MIWQWVARCGVWAIVVGLGLLLPVVAKAACAAQLGQCNAAIPCCQSDNTCLNNECRINTLAAGCTAAGDCVSGVCANGLCEQSATPKTTCLVDTDCTNPLGAGNPSPMLCVGGHCLPGAGDKCTAGPGNWCSTQNCPAGGTCACSNPGGPCGASSDCCNGGECYQNVCKIKGGATCSVNQCLAGNCNGICAYSPSGGPCVSPNDCGPTGQECLANRCVLPVNSSCDPNRNDYCVGDVVEGQNCVNFNCSNQFLSLNACSTERDCGGDQICVTFGEREVGQCLIPTGSNTFCTAGSQCVSGNCFVPFGVCLCNGGQAANSGVFGPCASNLDCCNFSQQGASGGQWNYECSADNLCYMQDTAGVHGATCAINQDCLSDVCLAGTCQCSQLGFACTATPDCCVNEKCLAGACFHCGVATAPCKTDNDCCGTLQCGNGKCH